MSRRFQECYIGTGQSCICAYRHHERTVLEVLLDLKVCHPHRALQSDLVEGPLQPCGERGDLLIVALSDLIKVMHQNIKRGHCAKKLRGFVKCGPH